jgi:prolyl oligopeptidase
MRLALSAALAALLAGCATADTGAIDAAPAPAPAAEPAPAAAPAAAAPAADPFQWLEEVDSERSMAWVREQNARSRATLEGDPRYEVFRREALAIFTAKDRIPTPSFRAGGIDNYWQDDVHVRGLWRRTTVQDYGRATPSWKTTLDLDALAKAEGKDWYWKGADCLQPAERICLLRLSAGGKDAVTLREFDTATGKFVEGGFVLPESKQNSEWIDADTLLVGRDWGPGTLTESGYAFVLKTVKRGQPLSEAREVFRGDPKDVSVQPQALRDETGALQAMLITRATSFFETEFYLLGDAGPIRLPLPKKSTVQTLIKGQMVFSLEQDWSGFKAGDLVSYDLAALKRDPAAAPPVLIARPTARQAFEGVAATRTHLVVTGLEDVMGFADAYSYEGGRWTSKRLPLPKAVSVGVVDASKSSDRLFLSTQGLLEPTTLWLADAGAASAARTKVLPARFDTTGMTVQQFWATSSDGTKIPYFLVLPKGAKLDGNLPTLMYGYGGFQVSKPSIYIPEAGKIWMERGGAYVIANIRGGGEFGPTWHQSVLREKRQLAFDDFAAVARDLSARKITSPRRLGIYGRSNGGVLTTVSMTQHPELWNAVVVESPLVDMLRYHKLSAGASWVGEYGNPDTPEDYAFISKYSGYQALKAGQAYPKAYITTNTQDDRVHPGHARKYAARLQQLGYDYLYFEDNFGGHSYDADPTANATRWARHYVYLAQQLMD